MGTKQRLGIDIVGADKTRSAFAAVNKSLATFTKGLKLISGIAIGGGFAATLKKGIGSLIEINKHAGPVKTSFQLIDRAWQDFALNVGSSGLNSGLQKFNASIGQMIVGSGSLAGSLGGILGGSVRALATFLQGLGRTFAFAYDNADIFGRAIKGLGLLYVAGKITMLSRGFLLLVSTLRAAGLATAIFSLIQRRMLVFWVAIIALGAKVTGTFENLTKAVDDILQTAEDLLPLLGDGVAEGLQKMGFDVKSLTTDFSIFDSELKNLPKTFEEIDKETKAGAKGLETFRKGLGDIKQFVSGLKDEESALGKTEGALTRLAQSQAFYNKMQDAGVKLTVAQKNAAEEWLNKIPDAVAGLERQKSALQTATDIGEAFKSSFSSAFASIIDGTSSVKSALKNMAASLLSTLANLFANRAFSMLINGGAGAGGTGGLVGGIFKSFGGMFANGGTLGAGKWGVAGEAGPEIIRGPATVAPMKRGGGGQMITYAPSIDMRGASTEAVARLTVEMRNLQRDFAKNVRNVVTGEKGLNPRFAR